MTEFQNFPFKPNTTRYHPENAYWMARFAALAYQQTADEPAPNTRKILDMLKAVDQDFLCVEGFSHKSTQAIIIQHENYVVAAFRGTDEPKDWLDNINLLRTQGPLGTVHAGFYSALLDVWENMWPRIQAARQRPDRSLGKRPLWLAGHSLGGALATLAAACLAEQKLPVHGVYTFGQPRCGDGDFQVAFDAKVGKRFFRFQNNNDIITRLPARLMGYEHVGQFIYITQDKQLKADISWWYQFLDRVEGVVDSVLEKGFRLEHLADHNLENGYIAGIEHWGARLPDEWQS
ncbi:MAG: lipase family protein [Cyanothece sp. SIO1E1]|nr:lipase family protein [Cyanothece sp. SIO1E1]